MTIRFLINRNYVDSKYLRVTTSLFGNPADDGATHCGGSPDYIRYEFGGLGAAGSEPGQANGGVATYFMRTDGYCNGNSWGNVAQVITQTPGQATCPDVSPSATARMNSMDAYAGANGGWKVVSQELMYSGSPKCTRNVLIPTLPVAAFQRAFIDGTDTYRAWQGGDTYDYLETMSSSPTAYPSFGTSGADAIIAETVVPRASTSQQTAIGEGLDGDWDGLDDTSLLQAYAPAMRFSPSESYRPASAALATDTFSTESPAHANRLERDSEAVASADPDDTENSLPLDNLSLSYLGGSALTDDVINMPEFTIDEPTSALIDYLYMLSEHPGEYDNKVYGRVVEDPEESGDRILQYWFYYYYNPKTFYTIGNHEGDWEWLQIRLDDSGNPTDVTFSQHGAGETCDWGAVMKNASGQAVVWPAIGSHANYFAPGDDYSVPVEGFFDGDDETAEANDYDETTPDVIDITSAPAWIEWDGSWGASGSTFYGHDIGYSPRSPGVQDGWSAFSWPEEPKSCSLT
jgi:hypothetical protein